MRRIVTFVRRLVGAVDLADVAQTWGTLSSLPWGTLSCLPLGEYTNDGVTLTIIVSPLHG